MPVSRAMNWHWASPFRRKLRDAWQNSTANPTSLLCWRCSVPPPVLGWHLSDLRPAPFPNWYSVVWALSLYYSFIANLRWFFAPPQKRTRSGTLIHPAFRPIRASDYGYAWVCLWLLLCLAYSACGKNKSAIGPCRKQGIHSELPGIITQFPECRTPLLAAIRLAKTLRIR